MSSKKPLVRIINAEVQLVPARDGQPADGVQANIVLVGVVQQGGYPPGVNVMLKLDNPAATFEETGTQDYATNTGAQGSVPVRFVSTEPGTVTVSGTSPNATPAEKDFTFASAGTDDYWFDEIYARADHQLADGTSQNRAFVELMTKNDEVAKNVAITWSLSGRPSVRFIVDGADNGHLAHVNTSSDGSSVIGFIDTDRRPHRSRTRRFDRW
jgi:hypothetical protein